MVFSSLGVRASDGPWNLGPLYDHFPLSFSPGQRVEALGPLFYWEEKESERAYAVPPLFSHTSELIGDWEETDILYPLLTYDRFGSEYRWQLLQLIAFAGGQTQDEIGKKRFTLFPIYFQQRSAEPSNNYTALFPLYGHLQNRLFRDEIYFVMFPIYGQSRKRDVVTDNYLYPFVHVRHGNGLAGWQFWPAVGHEHKDVTTLTNGFGDAEIVGGHDKWFAIWPIYFNVTAGIGTDNPAKEFSVLPFYSSFRSKNRDSTSVFWPFFNVIDDREKKYHEWEGPWPFVVFARGEGKTTRRIAPLFSVSHTDVLRSDSYLWPIYRYRRIHSGALDYQRWQILYFLFSHVNEKNVETGRFSTRTDLLPLFTRHRDFNGDTRFQVLAPIEPVLANNKSIERNWSPVWSVWRTEHSPSTGNSSQSLLWNLYRNEKNGASRKCSLLFGLIQYESNAEANRLRLMFVPVVSLRKTASPLERSTDARTSEAK